MADDPDDHAAQLTALIERMIARASVAQTEALEVACEAALQTGMYGVAIWHWRDGDKLMFEARVDPIVSYGRILEHPFGQQPPDASPG